MDLFVLKRPWFGCAALILTILLFGCMSDGREGALDDKDVPPLDRDPIEAFSLSPEQPANLIVTDGLSIPMPRGWRAVRERSGELRLHDNEGEEAAIAQVADAAGSLAELDTIELAGGAATSGLSDASVGGRRARVRWTTESESDGGEQPRVPALITWQLPGGGLQQLEFLPLTQGEQQSRTRLRRIIDKMTFEPYGESMRIREGLFAFHSFGSGWAFHRDLPQGAVFLHTGAGSDAHTDWQGNVSIALVVSRAHAPNDSPESESGSEDGQARVISLDHLGPATAGRYRVTSSAPDEQSTSYRAVPVAAEPERWEIELLVADSGQNYKEVWNDERLRTFFEACFAPAP